MLNLDVEPNKVILSPSKSNAVQSLTDGFPYKSFEIPLSWKIDVDQAGAQFDRSRRILTITLAVAG